MTKEQYVLKEIKKAIRYRIKSFRVNESNLEDSINTLQNIAYDQKLINNIKLSTATMDDFNKLKCCYNFDHYINCYNKNKIIPIKILRNIIFYILLLIMFITIPVSPLIIMFPLMLIADEGIAFLVIMVVWFLSALLFIYIRDQIMGKYFDDMW
ncbi:TPA: hypothetical protein GXZ34_00890 [bacterium]|nr:hypothetical protein [bacterium]